MSSPIAGLAWQLWARNRTGLVSLGVGLSGAAVLARSLPASSRSGVLPLVVLGSVLVYCYLCAAVTYSNDGGPRVEIVRFPTRMFLLPVSTAVLVAVPTVVGIGLSAALWFVLDLGILRPLGVSVSSATPALGMATATGFFQALAWLPYGTPLVRVLLATLLGSGAVVLALGIDLTGASIVRYPVVLLSVTQLLAYLAACFGVSRDRSGRGRSGLATPWSDWLAAGIGPRRGEFSSAAQALSWFEFRARGQGFLFLLGGLYVALILLEALVPADRELARVTAFSAAVTVPLWGGIAFAPSLAKPNLWHPGSAMPVYTAVRPVSTGTLYAGLLSAVARAAVLLWLIVVAGTMIRIGLSGLPGPLQHVWAALVASRGVGMAGLVVVGAALAALATAVWSMFGGLTAGLTGRPAVVVGTMLGKLVGFGLLVAGARTFLHRVELGDLQRVLSVITGFKVAAGVMVLKVAVDRGCCTSRHAAMIVSGWVLTVALVAGVGVMVLGSASSMSSGLLIVAAASALPLVQVAMGPLALAWNRHR